MYNIKINIAADNAVGDPLYMEDWGLKIEFEGLTLPTAYEVHFSNNPASPAKMAIGDSSGVVVPYEYTAKSGTLYGWLVFTNPSSGYTKRAFTIPITRRSPLDPPQVLPPQATIIEQAIVALNMAIERSEAARDEAEESAGEAEQSAQQAAQSAAGAANSESAVQGYAQRAEAAKTAAETAAGQAEASATAAANSANAAGRAQASAQAAATRAENARSAAQNAAIDAAESMRAARTAMEESADNAQAAADSAASAAESATSAAESATNASTSATNAQASATTAQTAQSAAESAASTATGKATEASESAADAAESAAEAEAAAERAEQTVTDSEAWALGAYATSSASGAVATVDDGAEGVPVKALTAYIVPAQEGTGDPSPDNVRPIHGWTGMNVALTGVNQWAEEWERGTINNEGVNASATTTIRSKNYIPVVPGETYNYYCTAGVGMFVYEYDLNKNFIRSYSVNTTLGTTHKVSDNCRYIRFRMYNPEYGGVYNNDISINYPASDTAYHPYTGQTYPVTWQDVAGTVYGGYFDAVSGKLTVTMVSVDLGALSWEQPDTTLRIFRTKDLLGRKTTGSQINYICSNYLSFAASQSASAMPDKSCKGNANNSTWFYVRDTAYTLAADFKTAMSGVQLVYELAEPIEYQLSQLEIKTLKGINNIFADTGDTAATVRADPDLHLNKLIAEAVALALENA